MPRSLEARLVLYAETKQNRSRSTRCVVSDHKPSKETSLSESSFAIRRRSITTSGAAPCRRRVRVRARDCGERRRCGAVWITVLQQCGVCIADGGDARGAGIHCPKSAQASA